MADDKPQRRQGFDGVTLSFGVLALAISFSVLMGGSHGAYLQWLLTFGTMAVGFLLLAMSLRRR